MNLFGSFAKWTVERVLQLVKVRENDEIAIACFLVDEENFANLVDRSLALIASVDSRRYARIRTRLRWIVGSHVVDRGGGRYLSSTRSCVLNPAVDFEVDMTVARMAGVIVHEATHSRLADLGFGYTRHSRLQIERICCAEENRFFSRLLPEQGEVLLREFDPNDWVETWNATKWQRLSRDLRRIVVGNA